MTYGSEVRNFFDLAWWNTHNYFHFKPERVEKGKHSRWPQTREEYKEKSRRVDAALSELFSIVGMPTILALGEITHTSAHELRDRLLPTYRVASLDVKADSPTAQVALLYSTQHDLVKLEEQPPVIVPRTPRGTRPMAVIDAKIKDHTVRIFACHWQARIDEKGSKILRNRMADHLSGECYDFINDRPGYNHVAIIGDFNEEPFEDSFGTLNAHRHRIRSLGKGHWADEDVRRAHLYNTAWRMMGEKHPHPTEDNPGKTLKDCAGSYYWEESKSWHLFDQLIVSGGLLSAKLPYIDEKEIAIVSSEAFLSDNLPIGFSRTKDKFCGLSDHLPLYAKMYI